jgi:hypothetical protein
VGFLIFYFFLATANATINSCPPAVLVSVQCAQAQKDFQLIKHLGKYTQPKMEFNNSQNVLICTYKSDEWISKYRYVTKNEERFITASSLEDLASVASIIHSSGFKVDYFDVKSNPFTTLTYKEKNNYFKPDQIFLYSGLESTFENNSFAVSASNKDLVSTIVINDNYMKSHDVAADTFQTGSNCLIEIK